MIEIGPLGVIAALAALALAAGFLVRLIMRRGYLKHMEEQRLADERAVQEAERVKATVESRTAEENREQLWMKP